MPLSHDLAGWTDWDVAAFHLGRAIGLFEGQEFATHVKGVLWTDNALSRGLHDALLALVEGEVLERRDEDDEQFRWRSGPV